MTNYYTFDLTSNNGKKLDYPVDVNLIGGIKYEWNPQNKGEGNGSIHAVVCCTSESDLSNDLTPITESEYNDIGIMDLTSDKQTIIANGIDSCELTATLPSEKGDVTFKCTFPDGTIENIIVKVKPDKTAKSGQLTTTTIGEIKVTLFSDVWFAPQIKRNEVTIIAT